MRGGVTVTAVTVFLVVSALPAVADHEDAISNGNVILSTSGFDSVRDFRRLVDGHPTFLGEAGASLTLRYTDPVLKSDLEHGYFGNPFIGPDLAKNGPNSFAATEVTQTWPGMAEIAIVMEAALDPAGADRFTLTAWLKNIGPVTVSDPVLYLVAEPNAEGREHDLSYRDTSGTILSQNATDPKRYLAIEACGTRADGEIGDFNATRRLVRGELTGADHFEGDSWIVEGIAPGILRPGDVQQATFVFGMSDNVTAALANAACPGATSTPPLPFWDALPDFAVTDLRIDSSALFPTPITPWFVTVDVENHGQQAECREVRVNSHTWYPSAASAGPVLKQEVCLQPSEATTVAFEWSSVAPPQRAATLATGHVYFRAVVEGGIYDSPFDRKPENNEATGEAMGPLGAP